MKQKEAISRARLHKLARLGIGLAAVTVLGGLAMTTSPLLGSVQVEAQEVTDQTSTEQTPPVSQEAKTATFVTNYHEENGPRPFTEVVTLYPGGSYTFGFIGELHIPREGPPLSYHYDEIVDGATYSLDLSRNPNPTITEYSKTVTFTLTVAGETTPLSYQVILLPGYAHNAMVN